MRARGKPTPAEVARFMRLSARLQADPSTRLTRAESALVRRMLRNAREAFNHETDLTIETKPQRTWQNW